MVINSYYTKKKVFCWFARYEFGTDKIVWLRSAIIIQGRRQMETAVYRDEELLLADILRGKWKERPDEYPW